MINFFRINDPFRLFAILGLMLVLSSIYLFVLEVPLLQPEMIWMLIGENMSEGKVMYKDILDDTGPFSAWVYWILDFVFGKNIWIYKIFAVAILFLQMVYLNSLFISYKSFEEITYIPAFVLMILVHMSFDILTLSPALMGSTFILFALGQLFSQTVLQKEGNDSVLLVGIFGGIAACFHFPMVFFLPFMILVGIIISGFSFTQLLLSIIGYFLPILICGVYYFWQDALPEFITEYILTSRTLEIYRHIRFRDLMLLLVTPLFFSVMGLFTGAIFKSLTVNQQKQLQLMLIFLFFSASAFFLTNRIAPYQLVILLPPLTYLISMLFLSVKKGMFLKITSIAFALLIPIIGYTWLFWKTQNQTMETYGVYYQNKHKITEGKTTLVLGNDLAYYQNSKQVTPYLNYHLTKELLADFNNLENVVMAFKHFEHDSPQVIVDEEGLFEELLDHLPVLKEKYRKSGTYYLLEGNKN